KRGIDNAVIQRMIFGLSSDMIWRVETWELSRISSLLRSSRNRLLMKYTHTCIVFRHNLVDEFRSVICADESDCFVEANLYLLEKAEQSHDLDLEALDNKQIREDFIMSSIDIVYKLVP
ncbi:hypothetical protein Tco_0131974, partial [Tanacetum coccineum]